MKPTPDIIQLAQNSLKRMGGVFIGEEHEQAFARQFLIEHMPELAASGVRTLYLEHTQATIDALRHGGVDCLLYTQPDERIAPYLPSPTHVAATQNTRDSYARMAALIEAADRAGVRVIGYETFQDGIHIAAAQTPEGVMRREMLGAKIIHETRAADSGHYLVLGGGAHSRAAGAMPDYPAPGLDMRLGIDSIDFTSREHARALHPDLAYSSLHQTLDFAVLGKNYVAIPADATATHIIIHRSGYGATPHVAPSPQHMSVTVNGSPVMLEVSQISDDLLRSGVCRAPALNADRFLSDAQINAQIVRFSAPQNDTPHR